MARAVAPPRTLAGWLDFVERQHALPIALGLDRVNAVYARLDARLTCPVFTVGGTNGKGSACAMLESVLRAAGYRTGLYTSPHLLRYNERVRIDGREADDAALCDAFEAVERAREGVALTYFEFGTLAAFWLFARAGLDAAVLEVGLGGRLDAVNIVDADCALLTGVAIDHVDYLGDTRERIGAEKAGIFRAHRPAVVADPDPPRSVLAEAERLQAQLLLLGRDFGYEAGPADWRYRGPGGIRAGIAHPALRGAVQLRNAAAVLCALDTMRARLPVAMRDIRTGLATLALPGRFQIVPGPVRVVLDVAHNVEAAGVLAGNLAALGGGRAIAVIGMLRDKDLTGVLRALAPQVARWHLASLGGPRGASAEALAQALQETGSSAPSERHASVREAFARARSEATRDDKILVVGSFLTVSEVMAALSARPERDGANG